MLELDKITFSIRNEEGVTQKILDHISLKAKKGEFIIVSGRNGAGKSTLLNVITGELTGYAGTLKINQHSLKKTAPELRSRWISKVSQNPKEAVIDDFTIEENMAFAYLRGQKRGLHWFRSQQRRKIFQQKLGILEMNLENRLSDRAKMLSGGQKQALSLIMATLASPEVLLLDEHTSALDPKMAERIMEIAEKIVRTEKITTLMISHNISHLHKYGDRILTLDQGKIVRDFSQKEKAALTRSDLKSFYE